LAALLHDIGHCLFSHCSERVVEKCQGDEEYPDAKSIQEIFFESFPFQAHRLFAEIFSLSIIGSRKFFDFIEGLNSPIKRDREDTETMQLFCDRIADRERPGFRFPRPVVKQRTGCRQDRLYDQRTTLFRIKLEIDLDRILSKLRVFSLKSYELPTAIISF